MRSIPDDKIEEFERQLEEYLAEAFAEEFAITGYTSLRQVLEEHKQIINFFPWSRGLQRRATEEQRELKFHVFCSGTDDFLKDPAEALSLYLQHRIEDQSSVRLWYELGDEEEPDERGEYEENHMIGFGDFPR